MLLCFDRIRPSRPIGPGLTVIAGVAALLCLGLAAPNPALARGGIVKLKTDNGPDGFRYFAGGVEAARYVTRYHPSDLAPIATICGVRKRDFDSEAPYDILPVDLRAEDANCPGYADLSPAGLLADADLASLGSCSTTASFTTVTFGGGAGLPYPGGRIYVTASKPADPTPGNDVDQCSLLLDTSMTVVNHDSRVQGLAPGGFKQLAPMMANHFLELIALEPDPFLSVRMHGSARYPGDAGLPVMFARRACSTLEADCGVANDGGTTDDYITASVVIDNDPARLPGTVAVDLVVEADRSVVNPKLGLKEVTRRFRGVNRGPRLPGPFVVPDGSRTRLEVEVAFALPSGVLRSLPVNLPLTWRITDPNDPNLVYDEAAVSLGIRPRAGFYDDDLLSAGFFVTRSPVLTGDALSVRFDAADLPATVPTVQVRGVEIAAGEFGASGLPGLDAYELRGEDPVFHRAPDLSPHGLLRSVGTVGDPGNADGIPFGQPVTTVNLSHTDLVYDPTVPALAPNLFALAYLNPGDTTEGATAIGASSAAGEVLIGNSYSVFAASPPAFPLPDLDMALRLTVEGQGLSPEAGRSSTRTRTIQSIVREPGTWIAIDRDGRPLE